VAIWDAAPRRLAFIDPTGGATGPDGWITNRDLVRYSRLGAAQMKQATMPDSGTDLSLGEFPVIRGQTPSEGNRR
jgi:hypothetical protein